jgi:TRAP-type transport system small permease protein
VSLSLPDPDEPRGTDPVAEQQVEAADARTGRGPVARVELPAFFRYADLVFSGLLAVLVAVMLVVVGWNVIGRFALGQSLTWSDEAARYLFIWMIFLGAALAHFRAEHISVEFFRDKAPPVVRLAAKVVRELIILGVLGIMLWGSVQVMQTTFGASALLGVPFNVVNAAVPVSAALMVLMSGYRLVRLLGPGGEQRVE